MVRALFLLAAWVGVFVLANYVGNGETEPFRLGVMGVAAVVASVLVIILSVGLQAAQDADTHGRTVSLGSEALRHQERFNKLTQDLTDALVRLQTSEYRPPKIQMSAFMVCQRGVSLSPKDVFLAQDVEDAAIQYAKRNLHGLDTAVAWVHTQDNGGAENHVKVEFYDGSYYAKAIVPLDPYTCQSEGRGQDHRHTVMASSHVAAAEHYCKEYWQHPVNAQTSVRSVLVAPAADIPDVGFPTWPWRITVTSKACEASGYLKWITDVANLPTDQGNT